MGTPKAGNDFLLKEGDGATSEAFVTIAGLRATAYEVNGDVIDASDKDNAPWRDLLPGGGMKSLSITADGIMELTETAQRRLLDRSMDGTINNYQIVDGEITIECGFQVTNFRNNGDLNDVVQFSITLESSGVPSVTP